MLRVKVNIFQLFCANRLESSQADVEGNSLDLDIVLLQLSEDFGREVKAGSRGGGRAWFVREDGLVAVAVVGPVVAMNIGRQRHVAYFVEDSVEVLCRIETKSAFSELSSSDDLGFEEGFGFVGGVEEEVFARLDFAAGADEGAPIIVGKLLG